MRTATHELTPAADPGEDVALEALDDAIAMMLCPVGCVFGIPFPRDDLETVSRPVRPGRLLRLAVLGRVHPVGQELAGCVSAVAGVS